MQFDSNFTEICYQRCSQQWSNIGSDNGLAPNRRQAIIWTNDGLIYWNIYVSLNELKKVYKDSSDHERQLRHIRIQRALFSRCFYPITGVY